MIVSLFDHVIQHGTSHVATVGTHEANTLNVNFEGRILVPSRASELKLVIVGLFQSTTRSLLAADGSGA